MYKSGFHQAKRAIEIVEKTKRKLSVNVQMNGDVCREFPTTKKTALEILKTLNPMENVYLYFEEEENNLSIGY